MGGEIKLVTMLKLAGALLLVTGVVPMFAQGHSPGQAGTRAPLTPVQVDNALSTGKPDDEQVPEADPSRPTVTNPAHIPPVGYLQFEQGFLQANDSPAGVSGQFSVDQAMRVSLHPRLMVQLLSQPFAISRAVGDSGATVHSTDPGDLVVGAQGLLTKGSGSKPTVALSYLRRVRAGASPDLDIGSFLQSGVLLVSGDVRGFHYDSNYLVDEQVAAPVRRAQYGQTLSVTHDLLSERLHSKLGITGELWHFTQPLVTTTRDGKATDRSHAVGTLWVAGYTARPNLVLDAGFDRGLTATSTAWQGFAGFTYLLPHRLWPHREAPTPLQ